MDSPAKGVGIDGFYASSQGGEAYRFAKTNIFEEYVKLPDPAIWEGICSCPFNILHICESEGEYNELDPVFDYPGHMVNFSMDVGGTKLSPREPSRKFGHPFIGSMDRKSVISSGTPDQIRTEVKKVLSDIPEKFVLVTDCTVSMHILWDNLKVAIETADDYGRYLFLSCR